MTDLASEKQFVRRYYAALDSASPDRLNAVLAQFVAPDYRWKGFSPFDAMDGATTVAAAFWEPLRRALTSLQRRIDIFMAGRNSLAPDDDAVWVCSMGHLVGLFDAPWLGIRPTGRMAFLRYCEFNRVAEGAITDTAMYFDLPHLMIQAGLRPFAPATGAELVQPGPRTHDGLMFNPQPPAEGVRTLRVINAMIDDLGQWQSGLPLEQELARTWRDDMIWWGPAGIGATYTIERYAKQHAGPFRAAFSNRSATRHICRLAEGCFGGFFGWPNFTATHTGGFMGMPAGDRAAEFRVIDLYRRDGDQLAENWVFIDLLHLWKQLGVDLLKRTVEGMPQ
ncbi:MAG: ester cyclase [Pseudomonadota bacterium]